MVNSVERESGWCNDAAQGGCADRKRRARSTKRIVARQGRVICALSNTSAIAPACFRCHVMRKVKSGPRE
jgi:hypothetical protein